MVTGERSLFTCPSMSSKSGPSTTPDTLPSGLSALGSTSGSGTEGRRRVSELYYVCNIVNDILNRDRIFKYVKD